MISRKYDKKTQKHLGIHLDEKLNFIHHIKEKVSKADKGIGVIKKLNNTLPRKALLTLSDLIWIMGTSYMTSQTMKAFVINLKQFSTMPHWLLLGQFSEHQK